MYIWIKRSLTIILLLIGFFSLPVFAKDIPDEYRANTRIQPYIDAISELFLQIDASNQIGEKIENKTFVQVYKNIDRLTPYLPQEYSFKIVYTKCSSLSKNLSLGYDYDDFISFMENCHRPLNTILAKIKANYTVKASAKSYPQTGPAPLVVTFDARASSDPSNETIPADNYYRYYRDVDGKDKIIGKGSTIKHSFEKSGTYKIHLTVRSSNHTSQGIFDGSETITVRVQPKSAQINVSANTHKLDSIHKTKFGTQEAQKGIIFDGSATVPMGGREILSHTRKITGPGVKFSKTQQGGPSYVKVPLQENGEYSIVLTTLDNETNTVSEKYSIIITDPVAIIAPKVDKGDTSTTISFFANESYSVISNLKLYTWEIFDSEGEKIDTFQGKSIKKQFKKPGNYTIKLTVEDALGRTNIATEQVFIESTPPVAQFSSTSTNEWKNPSEFRLDGSLSHDIDQHNGFDKLSYEWKSSDPQNTVITSPNEKLTDIQFNTVGTHTVTLIVKDSYGKVNEIKKDFTITSTLRPKIKMSSRAITWGEYINFVVDTNKEIISYQWDFGDTDQRYVQTNIIKHRYSQVGTYHIKLKVFGEDQMENEVYATVFVGDKNKPIPAYRVYTVLRSEMLYPKDTCIVSEEGQKKEYPAYQLDRYQDFYINAMDSVNSRGMRQDLKYSFKVKDENIYTSTDKFKYKFKKLGCRFVDLTLEDAKLGKTVTQRIWFKIYNSLPTLDNIELFFPQYGNQMGVGFNQNTVKDIFNSNFDPLSVKVTAVNSRDADGYISYYKRYYYRKDDPSRRLELKITPSSVPYAYFSLPRMPGEFMFGVTLYDNNEGITKSEDVIGNGPVVVFSPDIGMPDVPIVTAKVDKTSIDLGDEVIFDVISKIVSDKSDYDTSRVIRYDFEGDGKRDLTTKNDRVAHTYQKDGTYTPLVEVSYRGYYTEAALANIIVNKGIKPVLLFDTYNNFSIFRTHHVGEVIDSEICFDFIACREDKNSPAKKKIKDNYFSYTYPEIGKYYTNVMIKDNYANVVDKTWEINLEKDTSTDALHLLSIPSATSIDSSGYEILVGKNLDNSILYYVQFSGEGECYVDLDITDTKQKDFDCNTLYFHTYTPNYKSTQGKIYYTIGENKKVKNITVGFLDYSVDLDPNTSLALEKIDTVLRDLDSTKKIDKVLYDILVQTKRDVINTNKTQSNILALHEYLGNDQSYEISMENKKNLQEVITLLSIDQTLGALETDEYQKAKLEILSITPQILKQQLEINFSQLENIQDASSEIEYRKQKLHKIGALLYQHTAKDTENQSDSQITQQDFNLFVQPNICKIAEYYSIEIESCTATTDQQTVQEQKIIPTEHVGMPGWLKTLLIILGILVGGFLVMIIIFAVKARMRSEDE